MIKNDANKCAKQVETVKTAVVAPNTVRHTASEIDNHQRNAAVNQRTTTKSNNETDDSDSIKPLSKIDIIKKFDSKYKSDAVDNKQSRCEEKNAQILDEVENDENIQNSNDDDDQLTKSNDSDSAANNNYKNGNSYGNGNSEVVPPKPLPRTSRNNSVSSLSSEHGAAIEEPSRPVAKPRTTTTYKVFCRIHVSRTVSVLFAHFSFFFKKKAILVEVFVFCFVLGFWLGLLFRFVLFIVFYFCLFGHRFCFFAIAHLFND